MFALGGNPAVMEILEQDSAHIDKLLDIDSFPSQFRTTNPKLQKYMDLTKYETLVKYITELAPPEQKLRAYKFPLVAAEILAIDNRNTHDALFKETPTIIQQTVTQERWIQKEIDECDSEFGSDSKSNRSLEDFFDENQHPTKNQENIPPDDVKSQGRASIQSKKSSSAKRSGGSGGSNASITSDDFPFVEQKPKTVKVKKLITRKVEREIPPLLDLICSYFQGDLNHTLAGYICKVLQTLLKKNPRRMIRQFFKNTDGTNNKFCRLLLNHLESQSVCEMTINLLLANENEAQDARKNFLTHIIRQLATTNFINCDQIFTMKNMSGILMEIVCKTNLNEGSWARRLVFSIFEEPALQKLRERCFDEKCSNAYKQTVLGLFLSFLKKMFEGNKRMQEEQKDKEAFKKLEQLLEPCFKGFIQKVWDTLRFFQEGRPLPSYIYMRQLQISNILIKQNLFWARTELVNQDETGKLLANLCKKFTNNNLLHNQVFELFKFITHQIEQCQTLWLKIFDNKWFVFFCIEALSKKEVLYRGQCIYLCQAIKNSKTQTVRKFKLLHDQKWARVEELLHQDSEKINKFLGGFCKKPQQPLMMFEKEAILEHFGSFLKGQIVEEEQEQENQDVQDLTSSRGSTEWSDWNQFSNYNADEVPDS